MSSALTRELISSGTFSRSHASTSSTGGSSPRVMMKQAGAALIIVFIAAPALVKSIWRIKSDAEGTGQISTGWSA